MKNCLITFRSVTPAQRGELVLRRAGIRCHVRRTTRWMEQQGCGYSLYLDCQDLERAVELLRSNGIGYRKVYRMDHNNKPEELSL